MAGTVRREAAIPDRIRTNVARCQRRTEHPLDSDDECRDHTIWKNGFIDADKTRSQLESNHPRDFDECKRRGIAAHHRIAFPNAVHDRIQCDAVALFVGGAGGALRAHRAAAISAKIKRTQEVMAAAPASRRPGSRRSRRRGLRTMRCPRAEGRAAIPSRTRW